MLDELLPDTLSYLQGLPSGESVIDVQSLPEVLENTGKPCTLMEHGVSRCVKAVLEQLFGISSQDAIGANVATVLEFKDSEDALAELHQRYDPALAMRDRSHTAECRREVVCELIAALWQVHSQHDAVALPMSTGAGQMKRGQIYLWHPGVSKLLFGGNSIDTVKGSVYTGLLLSKAHETRYRGALTVEQRVLTDDDKARVVGVIKERRCGFVNTVLDMGLTVPDSDELYSRRTKALVHNSTNLGDLMENLGDGAIPVAEFEGNTWQARTFAGQRPKGLTLIGKGLVTKSPTLCSVLRTLGVQPTVSTCLTGNTKVGAEGVHPNGIVVVSQRFTPRQVQTKPVQLGRQMLRFSHGDIVRKVMSRTGWIRSIRSIMQLWKESRLAEWRKAMRVEDHSTGLKAMMVDGVEHTVLWPLVKAYMGRVAHQRIVNHKVPGSFIPISPEPALPLITTATIGDRNLNLMPILAPRGIGFSIGDVVWMKRNPTVTPGSNVPCIIVGFTEDATVGVHPLAVKWSLRGDFDGDEVALYRVGTLEDLGGEDMRWLDILRSFSRNAYRILWAAMHDEVTEPTMVSRSEPLNAMSYGAFVSELLFDANYMLGSCDAWTTLLCNYLQEQGHNPIDVRFMHNGTQLDAYSFFCMLESHTDTFKKRPASPAFADSDHFATVARRVITRDGAVDVPLTRLKLLRAAFSRKTPDRLQSAALVELEKLAKSYAHGEYHPGEGRVSALRAELMWDFDPRGFFRAYKMALNQPDCSHRVWAYDCERVRCLPEDLGERAKMLVAARKGRMQTAAYWAAAWCPDVYMKFAAEVSALLGIHGRPKSCFGMTAKVIEELGPCSPTSTVPSMGLTQLWQAAQDLLEPAYGNEVAKWAFKPTPSNAARLWPRDVFVAMEKLFEQRKDGTYVLSPTERSTQLQDLLDHHTTHRGLGFYLIVFLNRSTWVPRNPRFKPSASAWFSRTDLARRVLPTEAWRVIVARASDNGYTLSEDDLTREVAPEGASSEIEPDETRLDVGA